MPREARKREAQGRHHIVVQGKRRGNIFGEDQDKDLYLEKLLQYKDKTGIKLYAYCLLENHAHLVIQETEEETVSRFMRRIGVSYAYWYRETHPEMKTGQELFRGRYMSQPITNEERLLETIRYVHQEPVRLGLVEQMEEYAWSSYRLYLKAGSFIDSRPILDSLHFSGGYLQYMAEESAGSFLEEVPIKYGRSDTEARGLMKKQLLKRGVEHLMQLDAEEVKEVLRYLRFQEEVSIQQLSRISGMSRGFIQRLR